jgi:hypothetical protein
LQEELLQAILFGPQRLFSPSRPTTATVEDHALVLKHDEVGSVRLDEEGILLMRLPLSPDLHGMVIIEENVTRALTAGLRYAVWLFDRIDPTQRLTHMALAATLFGGDTTVWRTQKEQDANPNSYSTGGSRNGHQPIHLAPAHRPRAALRHNADQLVEDLVTLLRREWYPSGQHPRWTGPAMRPIRRRQRAARLANSTAEDPRSYLLGNRAGVPARRRAKLVDRRC